MRDVADHAPLPARLRLRVRGAVQGVGFRPFAYETATRLYLGGFVRNDAEGVLLEIEGARHVDFIEALRRDAPPLASIESIEIESVAARGERQFRIEESASGRTRTRIVADAATCSACLDELFDASSRFHLYPFTTCTHCGPRFTITAALPYDRPQTSMADFPLCGDCARDYRDPGGRRFHAETIACPGCGPRLERSPAEIAAAIRAGQIVAVKGVGGYHLMCDARNEDAVATLRRRKARDAKPFAVMAANLASVESFAAPTPAERALFAHRGAPIVLMASKDALAPSVAPHLHRIGVMAPYAPLHHLLFHAAAGSPASDDWRKAAQDFVIVATSANPGGEPLVCDDAEARRRLAGIADLIVGHDRRILMRADDSVIAIVDGAPAFLRRARGFTPEPIDLGADGPCVVALGGHLKTSVTVTRGREAFVSQHVGDLDTVASVRFFEETVAHLLKSLDISPQAMACDAHPDFFTTRFAQESGLPLTRAQHHAAHVAAIAAEHGEAGAVLGVALDGYGRGDDGGAWGGELMLVEGAHWSRLGHLAPLALPGGDRAAREPWRMGVGALAALGRLDEAGRFFPETPLAPKIAAAIARGGVPLTTSMGRLFDAAAALSGTCLAQHYEAQAAMAFEALARAPRYVPGSFSLRDGVLDFTPALAIVADAGEDARAASEAFHGALIEGCAAWIAAAAAPRGLTRIALGGGCLMNRLLAEGLAAALRARGFSPLLARAVPCNDGGLSLGQAAMARAAFGATADESHLDASEKVSAACV